MQRPTHSRDSVVRQRGLRTNGTLNVLQAEVDLLKLGLLVGRDRGNELLDAGDKDLARGRDELGHWWVSAAHNRHSATH